MPEWFCRASSTIHGFPPKARGNDSVVDLFGAWDAPYNLKSPKSPFDKLRANGGQVEIIEFIPFG